GPIFGLALLGGAGYVGYEVFVNDNAEIKSMIGMSSDSTPKPAKAAAAVNPAPVKKEEVVKKVAEKVAEEKKATNARPAAVEKKAVEKAAPPAPKPKPAPKPSPPAPKPKPA
ncbi:hypothetical protein TrLO_g4223, partial [Triparma laevis f. longispina]